MLTPKDIENKDFTRYKNGYQPEEVDNFLDNIYSDYAKLMGEKESLTKKVVELNERCDQTQAEYNKLQLSVINVQKSYDNILAEAQKKADKIVFEAQDYAKKLLETAKKEADHQQQVRDAITTEVEGFKTQLLALYEKHIKLISSIPAISANVDSDKSETLEILKVATADVPEVEPDPIDEPVNEPVSKTEDVFDFDNDDTVVMPTVNTNSSSDVETEPSDDCIPRNASNIEQEEDDKDSDEEEEEDSSLKGLFEKSEKKSLFSGIRKRKGLFSKRKDDDEDDDEDDYFSDDDEDDDEDEDDE